jgi:hypothetical protein
MIMVLPVVDLQMLFIGVAAIRDDTVIIISLQDSLPLGKPPGVAKQEAIKFILPLFG